MVDALCRSAGWQLDGARAGCAHQAAAGTATAVYVDTVYVHTYARAAAVGV